MRIRTVTALKEDKTYEKVTLIENDRGAERTFWMLVGALAASAFYALIGLALHA